MTNIPGGWRPDERLGQLPPEYEPVHHEPRRRPGPRQTTPWGPPQPQVRQPRQPQPQPPQPQWQPQPPQQPHPSQPQPQWQTPPPPGWQAAPPQNARYDEDPRGGSAPGYSGDDDGYEGGQGFMPGFADGHDGPEWGDQEEWIEPGGAQERYQQPKPGKPAKRRRVRWIAPWVAVLVILGPIAFGGYYAYGLYQAKYHPADYSGTGSGSVLVQVKAGDTATSLAPQLTSLGVVASSRAFVLAAEHSTSNQGLVPGFFRMHEHMKATLAYSTLLNAKNVVEVTARIPEGLRTSQILALLVKADPHISLGAYQQALKSPALGLASYANGDAEGYLFPATYQIQPNGTALSVLQQMTARFGQEAQSISLPTTAPRVGLNPSQAITVASLLQAEGGRVTDYPKIARVIYNRLARKMPLQLDSTVLFGLNKYGIQASDLDLESNSPYNTYKFKGLPPGPIDSPGDAAIQAALHPASGNWLYFVTTDPATGYTQFTDSLTQFEQFRQELNQHTGGG